MSNFGSSLQKGWGETGQRSTEDKSDSWGQEHMAGETEGLGLFSQAKRKLRDELITAYGYLKRSYRDGGAELCSGTWGKRGNSHKLQLGRLRLDSRRMNLTEGSTACKRSPEGRGKNPYPWGVFKTWRKTALM